MTPSTRHRPSASAAPGDRHPGGHAETGTIREDGKFDPDKPGVTIDENGTGRAFTLPGTDVQFILKDVRQVQLAKAALSVGIQIMLEKAGVTRVDRTILTGAFGAKFDWENARDIGMLPPLVCENDMIAAEIWPAQGRSWPFWTIL